MEIIKIAETDESPSVILDKEKGLFKIEGRSLPENVISFYGPVLNWVENYVETPNDETNFIFKLEYFNTSSSKMILKILLKLEELHKRKHNVKVSWYYMEDDEDIMEEGELFADIINFPFEYISY